MRTLSAGLVLAGLAALCGCGDSGYVSVSGVVLLDGEPVPEVSVAFSPEDPHGENATGFTDESGRFRMKGAVGDGVKPGKYKVTIIPKGEIPEGAKSMSQMMAEKYAGGGGNAKDAAKDAGAAYKQQAKQGAAAAKRARDIPPVYSDITKTPLTADVPAQTNYKFELKKDAK
jgi:hypothetical protein